jgi:hypothetical protein
LDPTGAIIEEREAIIIGIVLTLKEGEAIFIE